MKKKKRNEGKRINERKKIKNKNIGVLMKWKREKDKY